MAGFARKIAMIAAVAAMGFASALQAQTYVRDDCSGLVSSATLRFDSAEHARWYRRFWTGDCDHLAFCFPGSPNWNDIVGKLLARGGPAERAVLLPKACRLGLTIGLEWSRDKAVRKIDTRDLRAFNTTLEASGDALRGVEAVEAAAKAKLAP
ncbi:MAG: hypothetical protein JWP92_1114 [Caulobacter sp.]|nr:hypothetical protein [Caulobacter sp.]